MRRRARTTSLPLLCLFVAACGGDGSSGRSGSVSLDAVWEGSDDVPAAVQTVEIRVTSGDETFRELVDPDDAERASISGVPLGDATIEVFGYDVRLLGVPDLTEVDVAPSYASAAVQVEVRGGDTTDAGDIEVRAQPFVSDFAQAPGAVDVPADARVAFLLALAVGAIDPATIDIDVGGVAQVIAGEPQDDAVLDACEDGTSNPCGDVDRGVSGYLFRAGSAPLPPFDTIVVEVGAAGGAPLRVLSYEYSFETAGGGEG